jgi:phage host-nuclease inhibitor protein Gam
MAKKQAEKKPELRPSDEAAELCVIGSAIDIDAALRQIGRLENRVATTIAHEREKVLAAQKRMTDDTAQDLMDLGVLEAALEVFVRGHRAELGIDDEHRSMKLNCGEVGMKWQKPHLELAVAEETVINRMEAAELPSELIHVEKKPNLKLLIDFDADFLKPFGLLKKQVENFWYKVKPEVK